MPVRPVRDSLAGLTPPGRSRTVGRPVHTSAVLACPPPLTSAWVSDGGRSATGPRDPHHTDPCLEHDPRKNRREQAYFPAEQPSPRQDARLPPAHAYPRRPRHPGGPSSQGSHRALRLRPTRAARAAQVAGERADFAAVRQGSRWGSGSDSSARGARQPDRPPSGATAAGRFCGSKAVGNAVVRNRTKRRLRAQLAARLDAVPAGFDLVVTGQSRAAQATRRSWAQSSMRCLPTAVAKVSARRCLVTWGGPWPGRSSRRSGSTSGSFRRCARRPAGSTPRAPRMP